jgi:hypothetical protein
MLECLKQGKYNKPHWLRYIRGHEPPGPTEEEEEEEEEPTTLVHIIIEGTMKP